MSIAYFELAQTILRKNTYRSVVVALIHIAEELLIEFGRLGAEVYEGFDSNEVLLRMIRDEDPALMEYENIAFGYCRAAEQGIAPSLTESDLRCAVYFGESVYCLTYEGSEFGEPSNIGFAIDHLGRVMYHLIGERTTSPTGRAALMNRLNQILGPL